MRVVASSTAGSSTAGSSTAGSSTAGSSSGSGSSSSGGIAAAEAQVKKFTANPALTVSPLPSEPKTSTYAIQVSCVIPACDPGAMKPAMAALGWRFDEMHYDISKGPSAVQQALAQAIAAKPDVIIFTPNFPEAIFQSQVDRGTKEGIKFVDVGGTLTPGYSACIQCTASLEAGSALAADIALADAGGKTVMAVTFDPSIASLASEVEGVKQEVAKNGDGSQVLEIEQSVSDTPADNAAAGCEFLAAQPEREIPYHGRNVCACRGAQQRRSWIASQDRRDVPEERVRCGLGQGRPSPCVRRWRESRLCWRAADAAARAVEGVKMDPSRPFRACG